METVTQAAVLATGLRKSYGQGEGKATVLDGAGLELAPGEIAVILGPSGSGKTTLLNLLGLLDRPTEGRIELFGRDTSALGEEERSALRCDKVGFVFQFDSLLPEFTVLENVMLPALMRSGSAAAPVREAAAGRARALLERLGLGGKAGRMPQGLSGGEKQRAAIARALMNEPGLLLADEPTGNLDPHLAERVFADLRALAADLKVAVVLVTHNAAAASFATRALRLEDGRLTPA